MLGDFGCSEWMISYQRILVWKMPTLCFSTVNFIVSLREKEESVCIKLFKRQWIYPKLSLTWPQNVNLVLWFRELGEGAFQVFSICEWPQRFQFPKCHWAPGKKTWSRTLVQKASENKQTKQTTFSQWFRLQCYMSRYFKISSSVLLVIWWFEIL